MRVFLAVVEAGSLAAAADRLKLSRASTTRMIAQLEDKLSSRLLNRTSRQLSLTEDGRMYADYCRQILDLMTEADDVVGSARQEPRGLLRVCAPAIFGARYVAAAIPEYLALHPRVRIELDVNDREVSLVEEGFDLAIRVTDRLDPGLIATRIASCPPVVCAAPSYIAHHGAPRTPLELKRHNCLFYSRAHANVWSFAQKGRAQHVTVNGSFHTNSGYALLTAGLAGLGVIRLSAFHVYDAIRDGKLTPILTDYDGGDQGVYAIYYSRKFQPLKVRTFIDFLTGYFRVNSDWAPKRVR